MKNYITHEAVQKITPIRELKKATCSQIPPPTPMKHCVMLISL